MNLELRQKAWDALGWKRQAKRNFDVETLGWHSPTCKYAKSDFRDTGQPCEIGCTTDIKGMLPIELDTGIAMDALVKFCRESERAWELRTANPGEYCCVIGMSPDPGDESLDVDGYGATPAEAICKAIIIAAKGAR